MIVCRPHGVGLQLEERPGAPSKEQPQFHFQLLPPVELIIFEFRFDASLIELMGVLRSL